MASAILLLGTPKNGIWSTCGGRLLLDTLGAKIESSYDHNIQADYHCRFSICLRATYHILGYDR
jgi:hypothetical protein